MSATSVAVSIGPSSLTAMDPIWSLPLCARVVASAPVGWPKVECGSLMGGAYGWGAGVAKPYFGLVAGTTEQYGGARLPAVAPSRPIAALATALLTHPPLGALVPVLAAALRSTTHARRTRFALARQPALLSHVALIRD